MQLTAIRMRAYEVVGVVSGGTCETLDFLTNLDAVYYGSRVGMTELITQIAEHGFEGMSNKLIREASKRHKIYEMRKGDLRIFFFHGAGKQIAVCTAGVVKKGEKADPLAVARAAELRNAYFEAIANNTIEVI